MKYKVGQQLRFIGKVLKRKKRKIKEIDKYILMIFQLLKKKLKINFCLILKRKLNLFQFHFQFLIFHDSFQ